MSIERKVGFRSRAISREKCRSFCSRTRRRWISSYSTLPIRDHDLFFCSYSTNVSLFFLNFSHSLSPLLPFSSAGDYVFYIRYTHTLIHKHTYTRKKYLLRMSRVILSVVSILMIANHPLVANDQQVRSMLVEIYLQNPNPVVPSPPSSFHCTCFKNNISRCSAFLQTIKSRPCLIEINIRSDISLSTFFFFPFTVRSLNFFQLFFFSIAFLRACARSILFHCFFFSPPPNVILSI